MQQDKKECILRAAARAFSRFGFKKASVEEIAREAGVAKGTVYLAADTKEDLFYQALHREVRAFTAEMAKAIDPRLPADQLMVQQAALGYRYLDERPLVKNLLFGSYHLVLPEWGPQLDELRALGRSNSVEILQLGIRQGRFRADLELDEVAKVLQDLVISTFLFHDRPGLDPATREERLRKRVEVALEVVLHGLVPREEAAAHAAHGHGHGHGTTATQATGEAARRRRRDQAEP